MLHAQRSTCVKACPLLGGDDEENYVNFVISALGRLSECVKKVNCFLFLVLKQLESVVEIMGGAVGM